MWFSASLLFKGEHKTPCEPFWEESIRLIEANSSSDAKEIAECIGKAAEVKYAVSEADSIHWRFVQVERVCEIDDADLKNGTELFSKFLRQREAESLLTPFGESQA